MSRQQAYRTIELLDQKYPGQSVRQRQTRQTEAKMRTGFERGVQSVGAADDERRRRCLTRPSGHARRQLARGELIAAFIKHDGQRLSRDLRTDAICLRS